MEYQVLRNELDVLVVGAGPVGLWVACELALAKVKVAVLERRAEPVTQSRGLAIQGRTLEVFALRGLADRFLSRGRPIPKGHFGGLGTALDFSVFDTRFPFTLLLPQETTSLYRSSNLRPPRRASQGQIFVRGIRSGSHASLMKRGSRSTIGRAALYSLAMLHISMRQWVARA